MDAPKQFECLLNTFDEPEEKETLFALEKMRRSKKFILLPHPACKSCPSRPHRSKNIPMWTIFIPTIAIIVLPYFLGGSIQLVSLCAFLVLPIFGISYFARRIVLSLWELKSIADAHQSIRADQDLPLQLLHVAYGSGRVLQKELWGDPEAIFPSLLKKVDAFLEKVGTHRERLRKQENPTDVSELNSSVMRIRLLKTSLEAESEHWKTVFTDGLQFTQTLYHELSDEGFDPAQWDPCLRLRFTGLLRFYRAAVLLEIPLKYANALQKADQDCFPSYNVITDPFEIALQRTVKAFQSIHV